MAAKDGVRRRGRPKREEEPIELASPEERAHARADFEWYGNECLRIQPKEGGVLAPLTLNTTQRVVLSEIKRLRALGIPPRIVVLKSRQVGISTVAEALLFHECQFADNQNALVLAHNLKSSKALFRMVKRFADNLPEKWKQDRLYDNVGEIQFANESRLQVETVGEVRGYTAGKVHLSEFGFYEKAEETIQAIMQTVPRTPESLVIIESTANGAGNEFYKIWMAAVAAAEDKSLPDWERGWTPIFIPWFKHEEYMMVPWFRPDQTTQAERVLAKQYKLNMRQLAWRRWCIKTNCRADEKVFQVEYPSTPREAFLMSGRPVFDQEAMGYYLSLVPPETPAETLPPTCEIEWVEDENQPRVYPVEGGRLRIYDDPKPRHSYILGVDPSEGDPRSDPTPIEVLDQMTLDHVGEWWGRQPPDVLAKTAMHIGGFFNRGMIANEANNHGALFHATVMNAGYPSIYFREVSADSVAGKITDKPGFLTTNKSKHLAFDTLRAWVRERKGKTRSPILVSEMLTLIYARKEQEQESKILAQPGAFRDAVTAFAIALAAHRVDEKNPLEPMAEAELEAMANVVLRMRERDAAGSESYALDIAGMTCDELNALQDERERRKHAMSGWGDESLR